MAESPQSNLRELLLIIGEYMTKKEFENIKFFISEIPDGVKENITSHTELWNELAQRGLIDYENKHESINFLKEILHPKNLRGNPKLLNHVLDFQRGVTRTEPEVAAMEVDDMSDEGSASEEEEEDYERRWENTNPMDSVPAEAQSAKTISKTKEDHIIDFYYPTDTLKEFRTNFPRGVIEKNLHEFLAIGRNNKEQNLDIMVFDKRVSGRQCEITFDHEKQKFALKNIGKMSIRLLNPMSDFITKLSTDQSQYLEDKMIIKFDGLETGKSTCKNLVKFRLHIQIRPKHLAKRYFCEVCREPDKKVLLGAY